MPPPKGPRITQGKVRKIFFDVMRGLVEERTAIDIFAGAGTVGLEALSRGAREVIFIEKERALASLIKDNLRACGFEDKAEVLEMEAFQSLPVLKQRGFSFELFFIDPPYAFEGTVSFLKEFGASGLLAPGAAGALEHSRRLSLPDQEGHLKKWKEKRCGDTVLTFYRSNWNESR